MISTSNITAPLHLIGAFVRGDRDIALPIDLVQEVGSSQINIMSQAAVSKAISEGIVFESYNREQIDAKDEATLDLAISKHTEDLNTYDQNIKIYISDADIAQLDEMRNYAHAQDLHYKDETIKESNAYTDEQIKNVRLFNVKGVVDSVDKLPKEDNEMFDIYLVGPTAFGEYQEWFWNDVIKPAAWEMLGLLHIDVDLSNYYTRSEIDTKFTVVTNNITLLQSGKVDKVTGKQLSTNDFTTVYKTRLDSFTQDDINKMLAVNAAESIRVSNETVRIASEDERKSSETSRKTAETTRGTNETTRIANESARVTAEGKRVTAESSRATAETSRVNVESSRVTAETSRNTAETGRSSAEVVRGTNEARRETQETARQTNTATAITAVNAAKTATETATTNANTSATNANTQASRAKLFADNPPKIQSNYWYVYNEATKAYVNTNVKALGVDGAKGTEGDPGKSPEIRDGIWWVYDLTLKTYVSTGISVNSDFVLTKEKIEGVFTGTIDSHDHANTYFEKQVTIDNELVTAVSLIDLDSRVNNINNWKIIR